MSYDITDAQMDGAQESHRTIDWATICGLTHEYVNDDGMGIVVRDGGEDGAVGAVCENCRDLRERGTHWMTRFDRDPATDCWIWAGSRDRYGYGEIANYYDPSRTRKAHRLIYELHRGPIPGGLELDHLCGNPPCVNPDHLEPVSHRENLLRGNHPNMEARRRNTCMRGHSLEDAYQGKDGRQCRTCHRERELARQRRLGTKPRRVLTDADLAEAIRLRLGGMSFVEIGKRLGFHDSTLSRRVGPVMEDWRNWMTARGYDWRLAA